MVVRRELGPVEEAAPRFGQILRADVGQPVGDGFLDPDRDGDQVAVNLDAMYREDENKAEWSNAVVILSEK